MHPEVAHKKIKDLLDRADTWKLEESMRDKYPQVGVRIKGGERYIFTESPLTGESIESMIEQELKRRKNNMTKFTEVDKDRTGFRQLKAGEKFILFGIDGIEYICVKKDSEHAIELDVGDVMCVDRDAEVQRVELVEVKYRKE